MPRGRPRLPGTAEERALVRREKVLRHVRAHRARKKSGKWEPANTHCERPSSNEDRDVRGSSNDDAIRFPSTAEDPSLDISRLSDKSPIELSFGFGTTVVHDFQSLTRRYPYMEALKLFQTPDRIVHIATVAAAAATLSNRTGDRQLESLGRECYNIALQRLQKRVSNMTHDQLPMLATVSNCLMAFESANGSERTRDSPWGAHALGSALFLQLAGPEAYSSKAGRLLLRCHRGAIIQVCVYAQKSCFLDLECWRTIPFEGERKTAEDHVWDIAARLPRHMVDAENLGRQLRQFDKMALKSANDLQRSMANTLQNYETWLTSFHIDPLNRPMEARLSERWFSQNLPENVFTHSFNFSSSYVSELHMVYWSSLLNLHMLAGVLQHSLGKEGFTELGASYNLIRKDQAEKIANNICQSMEYCIGPDNSDLSGTIYAGLLPLQAATRFYKIYPQRFERQIQWCNGVGALVSSRGLYTRDYLQNLGSEAILRIIYSFL